MVTPGRMSRRRLLEKLELDRVEEAIRAAETQTSGEVRVSISPPFWGDVRSAAEHAFARMGMTRTRQRNAVLFFVVPSRRKFAVIGDSGIHEKVGQQFWDSLTADMTEHFRHDDFTGGLVRAIRAVAEELALHFPWHEGDKNELPDLVDTGPHS